MSLFDFIAGPIRHDARYSICLGQVQEAANLYGQTVLSPEDETVQQSRLADLFILVVSERECHFVVTNSVQNAKSLAHLNKHFGIKSVHEEALAELRGPEQDLLHVRLPFVACGLDALSNGARQLVFDEANVFLGAMAAFLKFSACLSEKN